MCKRDSILKRSIAFLFVIMLIFSFIRGGGESIIERLFMYVSQQTQNGDVLTLDTVESEYISSLWVKSKFIDLNGTMARRLGMQGYYGDIGIYVNKENYIVSSYKYTTTDYEYDETIDFRNFLKENNIKLLYVNEPTKYTDDSLFKKEFGVETYTNRNMDYFLSRIKAEGVNAIDIRDNIREEKINVNDLFYRTDHHWTTSAGLWGTSIIAKGLNEYCGYKIDLSMYDSSNYIERHWSNCWLGEQGRKVAKSYVGLDDYTELKPNFDTSYIFKNADGSTYEGSFDDFLDESVYNTDNDVYMNGSWHYSYKRINCINNNVEDGKILILGDSFDHVTQPFLSLGVHEVDSLILRDYDSSFDLRNYIIENGYDTVIIAYAQFMLGAHDNVESANYRMFTFR